MDNLASPFIVHIAEFIQQNPLMKVSTLPNKVPIISFTIQFEAGLETKPKSEFETGLSQAHIAAREEFSDQKAI